MTTIRNSYRSRFLAVALVSTLACPSLLAADRLTASRPAKLGVQYDTAPILGSMPVKCLTATSDATNASDPPACLFIVPGGALTLKPGQTAGVLGPGPNHAQVHRERGPSSL